MPTSKSARRRTVRPVMAAVVRPVTKRLSRIEDILIEMRGVQDVHFKRIAALRIQLDELTQAVKRRLI